MSVTVCPSGKSIQFRRVVRVAEAAAYVGLSVSTLNKMRIRGDGPTFIKSGPKIVVYDVAQLDGWLNSRVLRNTSESS